MRQRDREAERQGDTETERDRDIRTGREKDSQRESPISHFFLNLTKIRKTDR